MAFTQSENTIIRKVIVPKLSSDYKVEVLANSYKDGTVELTLVDETNNLNIDYTVSEAVDTVSNVVIAITRLIANVGVKVTNKLIAAIRRSVVAIIHLAEPFAGRPTLNYHVYGCQAKLIVG